MAAYAATCAAAQFSGNSPTKNGSGVFLGAITCRPRAASRPKRRFKRQPSRCSNLPSRIPEGTTALHGLSKGLKFQGGLRSIHIGQPVSGLGKRPGAKECPPLGLALVAPPKTAPAPILCPANQVRPKRVSLHVTGDGEKVFIALDRKGLKASLIEWARTACPVKGMPALRMGDREPAQCLGELLIAPRPQ